MGFLTSADVIECSATDLVGSYVGHTGPKVINKLTEALGKVLFIDEAYRLSEGTFASEAVAEIVDSLTKPKFMNKLIVILAGYETDINELLKANQGLSSRFPGEVTFTNLEPIHCLTLLTNTLQKSQIELHGVDDPSTGRSKILGLFRDLSGLKAWANGRDVMTAAKAISQSVFEQADPASPVLAASSELVIEELTRIYNTNAMRGRTSVLDNVPQKSLPIRHAQAQQGPPPKAPTASSNTATPLPPPKPDTNTADNDAQRLGNDDTEFESDDDTEFESDDENSRGDISYDTRDAGVSDAIWQQLKHDKAEAQRLYQLQVYALCEFQAAKDSAVAQEQNIIRETKQIQENTAANEAKRLHEQNRLDRIVQQLKTLVAADAEVSRRHEQLRLDRIAMQVQEEERAAAEAEAKRRDEQLRLERVAAIRAREAAEAAIERIAKEKEEEEKKQQKLRQMAVCVQGYQWIKQAGGYRCAGGSHFVSESQLY